MENTEKLNLKKFFSENKVRIFAFIIFLMIFSVSALVRKPYESEGFYMSDATYHVLLTMQAYDEVPSSVHHWLPIQSYNDTCNDYIENGPSLIQDENGKNYYVSFSPIGFFAPYLFCKLFHLGLNINSIYIFNCLLMLLCSLLIGYIMWLLLKKESLFWISAVIYIFLPEVLYTQGIVYWHHSLSQVFLLAQIALFILIFIEKKNSKVLLVLFYVDCFLYPYTEWTGFISNVGIALGILAIDIRAEKKEDTRFSISVSAILKVVALALITIFSFVYFLFRFSSVASADKIISTIMSRAEARSEASLISLLDGYKVSFLPVLAVAVLLAAFSLVCKSSRSKVIELFHQKKIWVAVFIFVFPILENLVMTAHAIWYSFDRLKVAVILIFIVCVSIYSIDNISKKLFYAISCLSCLIIAIWGSQSYSNGKIVTLEGYDDSVIMRDYLEQTYLSNGANVLAKNGGRAWGYLQTFYHRNIYCTAYYSYDQLNKIAKDNASNYIVYIEETFGFGDTACYTKAKVIDLQSSEITQLKVLDRKIVAEPFNDLSAAQITDVNWTNGIMNANTTNILFENTAYNFLRLQNATKLYCNNEEYNIIGIESDSYWIHVYVDRDATACGYPSVLTVE